MMRQLQWKFKQRQAAALALACFSAALCLQGLFSAPKLWDIATKNTVNDVEELEYYTQYYTGRYLLLTLDESHLMEKEEARERKLISEDASSPIGTKKLTSYLSSLTSYTLEDAMAEATLFKYALSILVYDPTNDTFWMYYPKQLEMKHSYKKLLISVRHLSFMLRTAFPERFTPSSDEFAVAFSSGDYPYVDVSQLPHSGVAPVLHFGSVFRDEELFSNLVAMPMPYGPHVGCMAEWLEKREVCRVVARKPWEGEDERLDWEDLKPQVIWRGSDYRYLSQLIHPNLKPSLNQASGLDVEDLLRGVNPQEAVKFLRENYDELLPRWKGIVLANEAEQAAQEGELPWVDIKFPKGTKHHDLHEQIERAGVGVLGEFINQEEQSKYKYLIDLGGGGGTTWGGTNTKLAMPGLLFHHITPTKDYFHDRIKPYVHYVPISPDLSDLKEKYDWAESNPDQAKKIADQGTDFMRYLGTPEGFGQLVEEEFTEPLRKIIEAYQPVSTTHPGKTWVNIIEGEPGHSDFVRVHQCKGLARDDGACESVRDGLVRRWKETKSFPM